MNKRTQILVLALSVSIAGCSASLNPAPDIERVVSIVEERAGLTPAWLREEGAEAWDGRAPLTARVATLRALRNNRELAAELHLIGAARADLVQSGLLPNPILSAALKFPLSGGGATVDAAVVQEFTALWLRPARKDVARAELDRAVLSVSDRSLRLVASVKQSHARVMYGERARELVREGLALADRSIELTERRVQAGEGTRLDVNRLTQLRLGLEAQLARAETELGRRQRELLALMGEANSGTDWTASGEETLALSELNPIAESQAVELALSQRLDVSAADFAVATRAAELRVAGFERLPGVGGGVAFERDDGVNKLGPDVEVSVPIFDTGGARVARGRAILDAERARADHARQEAIGQARSAYLDLRQAESLVNFYRTRVVTLAEENMRLAERSLRAGEADQTVLLEAQRELVAARRELSELELAWAVSAAELEYAVGGRLVGRGLSAVPKDVSAVAGSPSKAATTSAYHEE